MELNPRPTKLIPLYCWYDRVVEHETGHTLGFPHEHMRREIVNKIDPQAAYAYFGRPPNNWDRTTVDQQDKKPIPGGLDINEADFDFAHKLYPPVGAQIVHAGANGHVHKAEKSAWDESADVTHEEFKKRLEAICLDTEE
ncbi:hypothetical protein WJX72_005998 [[Myrmecia] bisecta]|uniref:Peptidase M10 metallopeptidase domain-containing protein n=1 Tax=[Myrmecia] bisecta TaxID=41462 RepID=A0AAW1PAZ4_9CHLO